MLVGVGGGVFVAEGLGGFTGGVTGGVAGTGDVAGLGGTATGAGGEADGDVAVLLVNTSSLLGLSSANFVSFLGLSVVAVEVVGSGSTPLSAVGLVVVAGGVAAGGVAAGGGVVGFAGVVGNVGGGIGVAAFTLF